MVSDQTCPAQHFFTKRNLDVFELFKTKLLFLGIIDTDSYMISITSNKIKTVFMPPADQIERITVVLFIRPLHLLSKRAQ